MPNSFATRSPDSFVRLATATSSTPGSFWNPGMWRVRVLLPAPMNPTRIFWSLMARHCSTAPRHRSGSPPPGLTSGQALTSGRRDGSAPTWKSKPDPEVKLGGGRAGTGLSP